MTRMLPMTTANRHALPLSLAVLGLGIVAFTAGCVTTTPNPIIETSQVDEGTRFRLSASSIAAPTGGGWVRVDKHDALHNRLYFLKKKASPSHHLIADLTEIGVAHPIKTVQDVHTHIIDAGLTDYTGADGHKIVKGSLEPCERWGATAYKGDFTAHDYKAPGRGNAAYLTTRLLGYVIQHPHQSDLFIVVSYQQRGHKSEISADVEQAGEAFCATLELHTAPSDR